MKEVVFILITLVLTGCTHIATVKPAPIANALTLKMPYEKVYSRTMNVLASQGNSIIVANEQEGIIISAKTRVPLNESQADCGRIHGIPCLKDFRTTTNVSYSVLFHEENDNTTSITVNTVIDGQFDDKADGRTKQLACYSLGYLEKDLLSRILEK